MKHDPMVHNPPLPRNYATDLLVLERGDGTTLEDRAGNTYLDFGSGIAVNALGYGREDVARIAYEQMKKLIHVSNLYTTQPTIDLAAKLVESGSFSAGGFSAVHFGNSGAIRGAVAGLLNSTLRLALLFNLSVIPQGDYGTL